MGRKTGLSTRSQDFSGSLPCRDILFNPTASLRVRRHTIAKHRMRHSAQKSPWSGEGDRCVEAGAGSFGRPQSTCVCAAPAGHVALLRCFFHRHVE